MIEISVCDEAAPCCPAQLAMDQQPKCETPAGPGANGPTGLLFPRSSVGLLADYLSWTGRTRGLPGLVAQLET